MKELIAETMRKTRLFRNLSVRKAAKKIGISASYLSQIEKGKKDITLKILLEASKAYKVSLALLLGHEEIPNSSKGKKIMKTFNIEMAPLEENT
jgi:transcriptional regulator with XRE-family HTH domain